VDNLLSFFTPDEGDIFLLFWAKQLLISFLILGAFYLVSRLVVMLLFRVSKRLAGGSASELTDRILARVSAPAALLVNCTGLYFAIKRLPFPPRLEVAASGLLFVVNVTILATIVYRVLDEVLHRYGERVAGPEMSRQLVPLVQKLCSIFLFGTALIITLKHFNYDILSLVTALGVGSLAIGLAAKDTLANMISGFTLMLDRPFRIGDRIQLGSQVGDVIDIGLRSTKIRSLDNTYLVVPNSELCNTTLINLAFPDALGKGKIEVGVAYESDVRQVKELMLQCARSVEGVLNDPPPEAYFFTFGDHALKLTLFFWVEHYTEVGVALDRVNCAIMDSFRQHGITIPYPTRTVLLEKDPSHGSQD